MSKIIFLKIYIFELKQNIGIKKNGKEIISQKNQNYFLKKSRINLIRKIRCSEFTEVMLYKL